MKTTNVILIGVVGLGAVGAYMYMKNKKAQDNLLSGSLPTPATSQGGFVATPATSQGGFVATPATSQGGFATAPATSGGSTTPVLSTTSDGVSPSDANINLANATVLVGQRAILQAKIKAPFIRKPQTYSGGLLGGLSDSGFGDWVKGKQSAQKSLIELDKKLANLGYKVDSNGALVRI